MHVRIKDLSARSVSGLRLRSIGCGICRDTAPCRYASLDDGDTFLNMRRCANVIECTYKNLDSRV